jgi:serine/threonine protein kinase
MSLDRGTRLGPYEVLEPIGAGGMGEVYRASDPRTGREVAIKVSAERFSDRFDREVRAVAALNHANNICHLYDVGPNYLVMELVEGPTLAERIQQGAVPLEEASVMRARSPMRWKRRTKRASSIATSSRRTSRSLPRARSRSWISDSQR